MQRPVLETRRNHHVMQGFLVGFSCLRMLGVGAGSDERMQPAVSFAGDMERVAGKHRLRVMRAVQAFLMGFESAFDIEGIPMYFFFIDSPRDAERSEHGI